MGQSANGNIVNTAIGILLDVVGSNSTGGLGNVFAAYAVYSFFQIAEIEIVQQDTVNAAGLQNLLQLTQVSYLDLNGKLFILNF